MAAPPAVGQRVRRVDGREKVTGEARFGTDVQLPGMLHARCKLSPYAHARIVAIDTEKARQAPGVRLVVTGRDLKEMDEQPTGRHLDLLARDRVRFYGEPVAAVVAESEAAAADAVELIEVEYDPLPAALDPEGTRQPDAPLVWEKVEIDRAEAQMHATVKESAEEVREEEQKASNVASQAHFHRGDPAQGFKEAEADGGVVVECTYRNSRVHQSYIEPHACVAAVDPVGGGVTVWTTTQGQFYNRAQVASVLGLPETSVKVVPMFVGGGFGGKIVLGEPLAAVLSRHVKQPVSLVYTRMEEFLSATPTPEIVIKLKTGMKRDGTLTALEGEVIMDMGVFAGGPLSIACLMLGGYYKIPNFDIRGYEVLSHRQAQGAYRGPGATQAVFAMESQMDVMIRKLGLDPLEVRLKNAVKEGDLLPNGDTWPRIGLIECLERARQHPLWQNRKAGPANGHGAQGVGLAVGGWLGGLESAAAACRVNNDGTIQVMLGSIDISGTNTGLTQMAADAFGVPVEKIQIVTADTSAAPYTGMSGGSKITYTVGPAVIEAAQDARRQILGMAAEELEASIDDLEIDGDVVRVRGVPDKQKSLGALATMSQAFGCKYPPVMGTGRAVQRDRAPGFGAHLVKVVVDTETGAPEVTDYVAIHDVGRAINPAELEGQIRGGATQGIGWALREGLVYDENGQLVTASFMDYALPKFDNTPNIEVILLEVPAQKGPYGAKGIGEPPVIMSAPAVTNAIQDAIGIRFTELPVTQEKIFRALQSRR